MRTKDYWYVYKYTTHKIVTPEHSEVIAANPEDLNTPPSKRMITLTTCEPKYTTATHRWISYGELSYWAKVSDGVPQELATSSSSAKVAFSSSNTSQSFVSKLGTLQPIVLWALVAYLVLYIAAWWPGGTRCCARFAPASAAVRTRASTDGCCVTSPVRW